MTRQIKAVLLVLSSGAVALSTGTCLARFMGDLVADQIWLSVVR